MWRLEIEQLAGFQGLSWGVTGTKFVLGWRSSPVEWMLNIVAVGGVTPWEVRLVLGVLEVSCSWERDQKVT